MKAKHIRFFLVIFILTSFLFTTCHNMWMQDWWPLEEPERSGANFAVVYLDLNGGQTVDGTPGVKNAMEPFRVLYDTKIPRVRPVTHADITLGFYGWIDEFGNLWDMETRVVKQEDDADGNGVIILTAQWMTNIYAVIFDPHFDRFQPNASLQPKRQDGVTPLTVDTQRIIHGGKVVEPPVIPTGNSYGLVGWFTQEGSYSGSDAWGSGTGWGERWDFANSYVSSDITLHARWETYTRTVHLQVNGGKRPDGVTELTRVNFTIYTGAGGSIGGRIIDPGPLVREGYTFAGWYTEAGALWNFADVLNEVDNWDTSYTPHRLINEYFILHARWETNIYYVTFDTKGGSPAPARQEVKHGDRATLPSTIMTPPVISGVAQAFDGWFDSAGVPWNFDTRVVTSTITLTARWSPPQYTVRFYLGTGAGESAGKIPQWGTQAGRPYLEQSYKSSSDRVIEPYMPVNTDPNGWSFEGWYVVPIPTASDVSNINNTSWRNANLHPFNFNASVGSLFLLTEGNVQVLNLYAKWVPPVPDMAWVPRGSFIMGDSSVSGSPAAYHAYPTRRVTVDGFYISKYEVTEVNSPNNTIRSYATVMGTNPSQFSHNTNRPVERVSWYDAIEYGMKLTEQTLGGSGNNVYSMSNIVRTPISGTGSPGIPSITSADVTVTWNRTGYRLPTEAEWEYAARGGNGSPGNFVYSGSNSPDAVAWYNETVKTRPSGDQATQPVGSKQANALGIYDMSGNVSEWVWDWFDSYKNINPNGNPLTNPKGPESSPDGTRVRRGGSWSNAASNVRNVVRNSDKPETAHWAIGFRVVRGPGTIW